jgi:hypothetical protein
MASELRNVALVFPALSGVVIRQLLMLNQHTPEFFIMDICHLVTAIIILPNVTICIMFD